MEWLKEDYKKVCVIDDVTIYKNSKCYFTVELYKSKNNTWVCPLELGKNAKEVRKTLSEINGWNYRFWHEPDGKKILLFYDEIDKYIK